MGYVVAEGSAWVDGGMGAAHWMRLGIAVLPKACSVAGGMQCKRRQ